MGWRTWVGQRRVSAFVQAHRSHSAGLIRGTALMAGAEMGNRVSRILTAVVMGRALSAYEFGMIALIMTTYEFVRMLLNNGLGARIVQAREDELHEVCAIVSRLNWVSGAIMCLAQFAVAWPVQAWFGTDVAPMLMLLGLVHLIYPIGLVHSSLALRQERFTLTAGMMFFQITMDNICTAAMAFMGYGVWAVVVPKVFIAAAWVGVMRLRVGEIPRASVTAAKTWDVLAYARNILGAEALNTIRANADKIIVGKVLGVEAVGIYSFASNAGSGIAMGLATALGNAILPFIARGGDNDDAVARFRTSVLALSLVIMPIVALQVALAPWYVPIVFGAKWTPAIPALMLMCLGMLSRPLVVATSQFLRATANVELEMKISSMNLVLFVVAIVGGLPYGVNGVAGCLAAVSCLPTIFFARMAIHTANDRAATAGAMAEARA
jgi:teichuronic acid exporter